MSEAPLAVRLARLDFRTAVRRDSAGHPTISPEAAVDQGARVLFVDVRDEHELTGPLGYPTSAIHVPLGRLMELLRLGHGARIVLLSGQGDRAVVAARLLELAGMKYVAAMTGGIHAWRDLGLPVSYDLDEVRRELPEDADAPLVVPPRAEPRFVLDDVVRHVSETDRIRWVKLAAFLVHGRTACVDGRDSQGVVGAPGGDAGELLLGLAALEKHGVVVPDTCMAQLIIGWADAFGRIYLHSDVSALNRLIMSMRADPRIPASALPDPTAPAPAWRALMAGPPEAIRGLVLEHLTQPDHIGCGHLKFNLKEPEAYGVRPGLVISVLSAFFHVLWSGAPECEFVVLGGGHAEGGVLLVKVEGELYPYSRVPLIPPSLHGGQLFVHHPQVTALQRWETAHWLAHHDDIDGMEGREVELLETIKALGAQQMNATLGRLAKGLPIFEVTFSRKRAPTVVELGVV